MSFHHILTSNVAPKTFPKNCASQFSTPIHTPYELDGRWEVALTQMTHSSCVYTFHNEYYSIKDTDIGKDVLDRLDTQLKIEFSFPKKIMTREEFYAQVKENVSKHDLLKHVLEIKTFTYRIFWRLKHLDLFIVLSRDLQLATNSYSTVITARDHCPGTALNVADQVTIEDATIIIGKTTVNVKHYQLKEPQAEMSLHQLVQVYNEQLPPSVTSIRFNKEIENAVYVEKYEDDGLILLFNEGLSKLLTFTHAAYSYPDSIFLRSGHQLNSYALPWIASLIRLNPMSFTSSTTIYHLTNKRFTTRAEVCSYLNSLDNRVVFSCDNQNITSMKILSKSVTVKFDDDLRDILAFDKNEYTGPDTYVASGTLTLSRRIQYLYIYSNINNYIRIGDTQAPLLAILPFDGSSCAPHIERKFKYPMYISLAHNNISQIDIEIRDDAGQLVPFVDDALTTIRLHFQQNYAKFV